HLSLFSNHPATTKIYTLSLHDALPISKNEREIKRLLPRVERITALEPEVQKFSDEQLRAKTVEFRTRIQQKIAEAQPDQVVGERSEEHTSELQSPYDLVCRLLLEKKKI